MHIYFGAFFALVAVAAIGLLVWQGWQTRTIGLSTANTPLDDTHLGNNSSDSSRSAPDMGTPEIDAPEMAPHMATSDRTAHREAKRATDGAEVNAPSRTQLSPQMLGGVAWLSIFLTTLISPDPVSTGYKGTLLFCLLIAGLALAFYHSIPAPVSAAGAFLLFELAILYFAFTDLSEFRMPTPLVLLAPALGIVAYLRILRPAIRAPRLPQSATTVASSGPGSPMPGNSPSTIPTPEFAPLPTALPVAPLRHAPGLHETGIFFLVLLTMTTWQAVELWAQRSASWTIALLAALLLYWLAIAFHQKSEQQIAAPHLAASFTTYTVAAFLLSHLLLAISVWTW